MSSVGSFFSYVNDARSHEPEAYSIIVDAIMESITPQTTLTFHYVIEEWFGLSHTKCSDYVHPQEADVGSTLTLRIPDEYW